MMGRIAAIDALDTDYRHVLIASASGGVFKSINGGITWETIFDDYEVGSIGSVAMFQPDPSIIWVGTGESANRNSSGWGDGLYKSEDGGKTFKRVGLEDTRQIAAIALHPTNPDIAYVAAVGSLWGYSGSRGLYMTTDGGASWEKMTSGLPDDGKTGCTEIVMHPDNPDILFAGFYHRLRQPASFYSGGPNGGLFKSMDGGKSWKKITKGLAPGESGMIDVAFHLANPDIMVMAYEADENLPEDGPGTGVYRSDDGGESWEFLLKHAVRPFYHGQIEIDPIDPDNIYVVSRGFMISNDGGKTFHPRRWRTDGGDDHDMWIAPYDNKIMYLATDQGARLTVDGGKSFLSFNNMAIGQYYAIGVDMRDPYHVVGGLQDNGEWIITSNSRDWKGILNQHALVLGGGDGFHCQVDPEDWRTIYLVSHVGFAARINHETGENWFITPTPETISNYEDFVDPNYPETPNKYTIDPGDYWFFGGRPDRTLLPAQFRFNWSSPLIISPNNPQTIYFGGNHLFKSVDKGENWRIISPDLTTNDPKLRNTSNGGGLTNSNTGGENHFTIITISESPIDDDIVWAGTDDGNVQVTRNGGVEWENVKLNIPGIPEKIWVSRVEAGHHDKGTAYVTFDNHRFDDYQPYVFKTSDYGKTWVNITSNLPDNYSTYVVKEDYVNPNLLFVGTESAVHYSINGGNSWGRLMKDMPSVAIHDLVIHPRDGDLIAGTHGRSIWICDDISALRQISNATISKDFHVFESRVGTKWQSLNVGRTQPQFEFRGENPPRGSLIHFYLKEEPADSVSIRVEEFMGSHQTEFKLKGQKGINRTSWRFNFDPSEEEIAAYKTKLSDVIKDLGNRVDKKELKQDLKEISGELNEAVSSRELNAVRSRLQAKFNAYAIGRGYFGEKMSSISAKAGEYKVTVTANGQSESIKIKVREDPLLAN
jgi:photosystem II stability/assembly factor-like uncharacterized protein